ncbi:MAG TPA: periplasmic heavy metal sensor [Phycisphaerae bacterium]|nr:periplasmic heavy metal sensor [Phycisphaerae bacterium]
MRRSTQILILLAAVAVGISAFIATVYSGGAPSAGPRCPLGDWLRLPTDQCKTVCDADPGFRGEAGDLADRKSQERLTLAALLEDPATPGDQILDQVERVIAANAALERRVAQHLLAIRSHLTPDQQGRLLRFCAESVRRGCCVKPGGNCGEPAGEGGCSRGASDGCAERGIG